MGRSSSPSGKFHMEVMKGPLDLCDIENGGIEKTLTHTAKYSKNLAVYFVM